MDPIATGEHVGKLLEGGGSGIVTVLCIVVVGLLLVVAFLYRSLVVKDAKIEILNDKRATEAGRVESALIANKGAIEGLTSAVNVVKGQVKEGMDDLGALQTQVMGVAQIVGNNGTVISEIRSKLIDKLLEGGGRR